MLLTICTDHSAAAWLQGDWEDEQNWDHWQHRITLGPPGFPAYARLRFIPDPQFSGQSEAEGARNLPETRPSELAQLQQTVQLLLPFTDTPDTGFLAIWEGWGEPSFSGADWLSERFYLPNREYLLYRTPLSDFVTGKTADDWLAKVKRRMPCPAIIYPVDRAWIITNDVDPHFAGIAASRAAITALINDPQLDIVRTDWHAKQPYYQH